MNRFFCACFFVTLDLQSSVILRADFSLRSTTRAIRRNNIQASENKIYCNRYRSISSSATAVYLTFFISYFYAAG